ncbi:hypothetical protein IKG33_01485 [Candidatus Saccharibacteria bacterium]|nr:hypothetical protein [Candidatus Saccharibacteria bacterium]
MKRILVVMAVFMVGLLILPVSVRADEKQAAISDNCGTIKENLKKVQKQDARTRVYLGGYYEKILSKFMIPLNVRLVENNLANAKLTENQNNFADAKILFMNDYVDYQQGLEELVMMDCKNESESFYKKLMKVREEREVVNRDVATMRKIISEHMKLVKELKGKL